MRASWIVLIVLGILCGFTGRQWVITLNCLDSTKKALAACQQESAAKVKASAKAEADAVWLLGHCQKRIAWVAEQACRCSKRCEAFQPPEAECSQMVVECKRIMLETSFGEEVTR